MPSRLAAEATSHVSFALIDAKRAEVPVETACAVLGVSESGFYAWRSRSASARQTDDLVMLAHIRAEFSTSNETYGSPRVHAEMTESGLAIGRHRVARLMSENGMKARQKTRFKKTTDSDHGGPVASMCSHRTSRLTLKIRNGALTYRMFGPPKAGCIWPSCSTSSRAGSSVGA